MCEFLLGNTSQLHGSPTELKKVTVHLSRTRRFPPFFWWNWLVCWHSSRQASFLTPESPENHSTRATFNVFICDCLWAHTYASGVRVVNFRWKLGFKSWLGHIVVFLGITCYPHRTTLYPGENSYHQIIRLNEMLRG